MAVANLNDIQFNVIDEGILAIPTPIDIGTALMCEALLDANDQTEGCDLIKARVNVALIPPENYAEFMHILIRDRTRVAFDTPGSTFGSGTEILSTTRQLLATDLFGQPYNFTVNLVGDETRRLRELLYSDQWMNTEGVLPITNPLWESISTPQFAIFGPGTKQPLCRVNHQFGLFYYLGKGRQVFRVIPRAFGSLELREGIRQHLLQHDYPPASLRCLNFMQTANLHFTEDYLRRTYGAKRVVLNEGECIMMQSGTDFQIDTLEAGFGVSFACVPNRWINAPNVAECVHVQTPLTYIDVRDIRERAYQVKNYAITRMKLAGAPGAMFMNVNPPRFPQRMAALRYQNLMRNDLGRNHHPNGGNDNDVGGNANRMNEQQNDDDEPMLQQFSDEDDEAEK